MPASNLPAFPLGFVVQILPSLLKLLRLQAVIVQTGEPATRELAEDLSKLQQEPTRTTTTPTLSSQSNRTMDSTLGQLTGQKRALRAQLEMMGSVIQTPNLWIWPWLIRHASWLMNKFSIRASGRTA